MASAIDIARESRPPELANALVIGRVRAESVDAILVAPNNSHTKFKAMNPGAGSKGRGGKRCTHILSQLMIPSPLKPRLHSHEYDSNVLMQVALPWQLCSDSPHSSTSGHTEYDQSAGSASDMLRAVATILAQFPAGNTNQYYSTSSTKKVADE